MKRRAFSLLSKRMVNRMTKLVMMLLLASVAVASPTVPYPDGVKIEVVSENMQINGLPLMAYQFYSQDSKEEIIHFYKANWEKNLHRADVEKPYLETSIGEWSVLSRLESDHNITVQIEDAGLRGRHVLVGISPLPKYLENNKKNTVEYNLPILTGMKVVSVVRSIDAGEVSETYWIDSGETIESIMTGLENYYRARGYSVRRKNAGNQKTYQIVGSVLMVGSNQERIRFDAVESEGKTRVVAVRTER